MICCAARRSRLVVMDVPELQYEPATAARPSSGWAGAPHARAVVSDTVRWVAIRCRRAWPGVPYSFPADFHCAIAKLRHLQACASERAVFHRALLRG